MGRYYRLKPLTVISQIPNILCHRSKQLATFIDYKDSWCICKKTQNSFIFSFRHYMFYINLIGDLIFEHKPVCIHTGMYNSVRHQQEQNIFNLILVIMSNPTNKPCKIKSEMSSAELSKYTNSWPVILIQVSRTPMATAKLNFYYKIEVYLQCF